MIEIENLSNIKPDSWYEEYLKIENDYPKEFDIMADKNQSHNNVSGFIQFKEKNNLEINKFLLIQYKTDLESLELWKSIKDLDKSDKISELYCIKQTSLKIEKCLEAVEQGYLITAQLEDIYTEIDDYWYNEQSAKPIADVPIKNLTYLFKQFKFDNYQQELAFFIKQNIDWRKKDRDFEIYNNTQNNVIYSILSEKFNITAAAISMIKKRVQSAINKYKGTFFEIKFVKYLKSLDIFKNCKIVYDGRPGKPDVYIMTKKRELHVLSLKNLELNKNSYAIVKEELKPELQFCYYNNTFEEINKVVLYLIVFDSLTEKIHVKKMDYKNPKNINIHR